ncbi:MBL fold metallo-hydrolase [Aquibaculum sediminis]|uniref:MBL fold metallo-hydrolase n=1 Tax=Aquibaculum sediminis TaxID=3231907 RepID=UPI0034561F05
MPITLAFHGAAGAVTGSCFHMVHDGGNFLVDCGLFQGTKTIKALNYGDFPFDPAKLDFVLLTHAHADHSGLLPKLVARGFRGPIYTTPGTADLLTYTLPDSAQVQESEVERLNRRNRQRDQEEVTPIYTAEDAAETLKLLKPVTYGKWIEPAAGVEARFWNAGHILGSASIELQLLNDGEPRLLRLLFSGDIGPEHKLFHSDPEAPSNLDYLICESTYGDRPRPRLTAEERRERLRKEVTTALDRGGNLLIPAFAIERTQELLADLCTLFVSGALPKVPLFLDSPLAIRATEVFRHHARELENMPKGIDPFRLPNFRFTLRVEESKAIDRFRGGAIIMAGSGMCDAGRIRYHLKAHLWRPDSTVLITGYQATGTMGSLLLQGRDSVRIHGEEVAVRAKIRNLEGYSGHADAEELTQWITQRLPLRGGVFLVHGEEEGRDGLRERLLAQGIDEERILLPQLDDDYDLSDGARPLQAPTHPRLPRESLARLSREDWHNDYAQLTLDIKHALDQAADAKRRGVLLRRLRRALEE